LLSPKVTATLSHANFRFNAAGVLFNPAIGHDSVRRLNLRI
jgi:hypothetical protein